MLRRLDEQGLSNITPRILVATRLIPESRGTSCNERLERIHGTEFSHILRVPFRDADGKVGRSNCRAVDHGVVGKLVSGCEKSVIMHVKHACADRMAWLWGVQ